MPLVGDRKRFKKLVESFADLGTPGSKSQAKILAGCAMGALEALRDEFSGSHDPDGHVWPQTVRHRPALASRQIPSSFGVQVTRDGGSAGKSTIDWLEAQDQGHVWPARTQRQTEHFDSSWQRISRSRFESLQRSAAKKAGVAREKYADNAKRLRSRLKRIAGTLGRAVEFTRNIGVRVLPPRPIVPHDGRMPSTWAVKVNEAATRGMRNWAEEATK